MAEVTVKQFAETVGIPVDRLLTQLDAAGIKVAGSDANISDADKGKLLGHLRQSHGRSDGGGDGGEPSKITLKRKTTSAIKLGGSQGRTVNVEVRKKRTYVKRDPEAAKAEAEKLAAEAAAAAVAAKTAAEASAGPVPGSLAPMPKVEKKAETKVEAPAEAVAEKPAPEAPEVVEEKPVEPVAEKVAEAPAEKPKAEPAPVAKEAPKKTLSSSQEKAEALARAEQGRLRKAAELKAEEAAAAKAAVESRKRAEIDAKRRAEEAVKAEADRKLAAETAKLQAEKAKDAPGRRKVADKQPARAPAGRGNARGRPGGGGPGGRGGRGGGRKGRRRAEPEVNVDTSHGFEKPVAAVVRDVTIPETITVGELAQEMAVKATEVVKVMMGMGVMATINQPIDQDTATLVVEEMGHNAIMGKAETAESDLIDTGIEDERETVPRPPVVTIMGHVDHGKTSLLDYIRTTKITSDEAGGITQHMGAYHVETDKGVVSFLDTPGHAAFSSMRARGAKVTDVIILVVAADDGVMPQTEEAIKHAKAAGVPIIVAVNKMDKPEADPDRVRNELSAKEIVPEEWGGDVPFINVSAHTGEGVDDLLDALILQAEVLELVAPVIGAASGSVVEASLEKGRGPVATVLVQKGTLKKGDVVVCGQHFGRVRAMFDELGKEVQTAGPSIPVQLLGMSGVPEAGDSVNVVDDERKAREVAEFRYSHARENKLAKQQAAKLEEMFNTMENGERQTVDLLLKADVHGSSEALAESLMALSTDEVAVKIVSRGVGGITESDVQLAATSGAVIIAFNVRADATARRLISETGVDVKYYSIIYEAIDDVRDAMSGMLSPEVRENFLGYAEVREVFRSSSHGPIAGCLVTDGSVKRANPIRVLRDEVVVFEGELESLRRFKDEAKEVVAGTECGIGVKSYNDVQPGDRIECFERVEIARSL